MSDDRILWNRRPYGTDPGDIDEIVLHGVDLHIEQMDGRCWWIGVNRPGTDHYWMGNFVANSRGQMRFVEQESDGITWSSDETHGLQP